MKKIKSLIILVLTFLIILNINTIKINAETTTKTYIAQVVKVIDGEALMVKIFDKTLKNPLWKIRLIGIKTNASEKAFEHVYSNINNKIIIIKTENRDNNKEWKFAYVKYGSRNLNEELLSQGLADLDYNFSNYSLFNKLEKEYLYAKENKIGIWSDEENYNPYTPKININTASVSDIYGLLDNTDILLANKIVNYRRYNFYNTKDELKFVDSQIDENWLESNQSKITLITNINTSEDYELQSLFPYATTGKELVGNILDYQINNKFNTIDDIRKIKGISKTIFDKIHNFISTKYERRYNLNPTQVVNINTASISQLEQVTYMSSSKALKIINYKNNNKYSYKTLEELHNISYLFTNDFINKLSDNLHVQTDINNANDCELKSLFGKLKLAGTELSNLVKKIKNNRPYNSITGFKKIVPLSYYSKIANYVFIGQPTNNVKLNLNLACKNDLINILHLSDKDAEKLIKKRGKNKYTNYKILPIDLSKYDDKITLYTNINEASSEELQLLHNRITKNTAAKIIEYRSNQRFANKEELKRFFSSLNKITIYNEIKDYVAFR